MDSLPAPRLKLSAALAAQGLSAHGFVGGAAFRDYAGRLDTALRDAWGLALMRGALVAALPYDPRPSAPPLGDTGRAPPQGRVGAIGAFAAAHLYAALARMLKAAAAAYSRESGHARSDFRVAVNSPLPEKPLAVLAGLAFIGRSSLAISGAYGPACVLGALILPFDPFECQAGSSALEPGASAVERNAAFMPGALCGACRACADACPSGAIAAPGAAKPGLDRSLCIQHWAADGVGWRSPDELPPAVASAWGARLYGCDECVRACPYSKAAYEPLPGEYSPASLAAALVLEKEARPGRFADLDALAASDDQAIKAWSAGSALGFSWLGGDAIRRNARMALLSYLEPFGI